jgi:hypothetical protein
LSTTSSGHFFKSSFSLIFIFVCSIEIVKKFL